MLGRDVVSVRGQPAQVGGALVDERQPPVRQVRRDLDAHVGHQPAALAHQRAHVVERDLRGPGGQRLGAPEAPSARFLGDLRRLLAVVAAVRHEVLEDHLLEVPVLGVQGGERLERLDAILLGLPDPHEDAARERDAELPGGADRLEPQRRVLRRRALVRHEVGPERLEHHPLRGGDLPQAPEVRARQRAQVRVREQPALERPLAAPGHVGHEVLEAELGQPRPHAGVVPRVVARQHEQLLHPPPHGAVDSRSTSAGSCRCVRCVAKAQYLQCETHVRESDSVRFREKVTRRGATRWKLQHGSRGDGRLSP